MGGINEFLIQVYFSQLYSGLGKKMYSKSLSMALTIAEINNRNRDLKRLKQIYDNPMKLKIPVALPILEQRLDRLYVNKLSVPKMKRERINGEIIPHFKIVKALADAYNEITLIVTRIAKDLNVDVPFDMSKYPVETE